MAVLRLKERIGTAIIDLLIPDTTALPDTIRLRRRGDLIISETTHGFVCANAGVDLSNVDEGWAALLSVATYFGAAFALSGGLYAVDLAGSGWC